MKGKIKKEKSKKPRAEKNIERQLIKILGFLGILVIIFLVSSSIFKSMGQVEYEGLTFTKERPFGGNLTFYHYSYYFAYGDSINKYNLFVRNDPSKNDIPISGDEIAFNRRKFVYVTINDTGLKDCPQSILAVGDLTNFFRDNLYEVKPGVPDSSIANETDERYITCERKPDNAVVYIREGPESKIEVAGNCFDIEVANCEILEAVEKFKVHAVIDGLSRASN